MLEILRQLYRKLMLWWYPELYSPLLTEDEQQSASRYLPASILSPCCSKDYACMSELTVAQLLAMDKV